MKRVLDIFASALGLIILSPVFFVFISLIYLQDRSSPFYKAQRVGKNEKIFTMVKLRSMIVDADKSKVDSTASDDVRITKAGSLIRRYKLDELTQLWNVMLGDMSLVGPRPCLLNQRKLISERKKRGVFKVKPGITGLAQISDVNMKTPTLLAKTDLKMIKKMNLFYYFYYILRTILKL